MKLQLLVFVLLALVPFQCRASVDVSQCNSAKGCFAMPDGCLNSKPDGSDCNQIVTWQVSPADASKIRVELFTKTSIDSKQVDYVAFAQPENPSSVMANSSVIFCAHSQNDSSNAVYFGYTVTKGLSKSAGPLEGELASLSLETISIDKTGNDLTCVVDRPIKPVSEHFSLVYPADEAWAMAIAYGQTSATSGNPTKHVSKTKSSTLVKLSDYPKTVSDSTTQAATQPAGEAMKLDLSQCGSAKGCLKNPKTCTTSDQCTQVVTWQISPDDKDSVRFEMQTSTTQFNDPGKPMLLTEKKIDFLAFGLAENYADFMGDASVLVCGATKDSTVIAYLSHNQCGGDGCWNEALPVQTYKSGVNLVKSELQGSRLTCIVDRKIKPSSAQVGLVYPLDQPWYPAWAAGTSNDDGDLPMGFHDGSVEFSQTKVTLAPSSDGFTIDLSKCDAGKGCVRNPANCAKPEDCTQLVTWQLSPDDKDSVRFEMETSTTQYYGSEKRALINKQIDFLGFALAASPRNFMSDASVLVCGVTSSSKAIAYLSHNQCDGKTCESEPLPTDQYQVGLSLVRSEVSGSRLKCIVDRKIKPSAGQAGLAFSLDETWYTAWAAGTNENGDVPMGYHDGSVEYFTVPVKLTEAKSPYAPPVTTPPGPAQYPNIDVSKCDKGKGCLKSPNDCTSAQNCEQIITWYKSPSDSSAMRFEMSTWRSYKELPIDYVAFAQATGSKTFMTDASVMACILGANGIPRVYLSRNENRNNVQLSADIELSGLNLISVEAKGSYISCVVDRKITPEKSQDGKVFPLNQDYYVGWAIGPAANGVIQPHRTKLPYPEAAIKVTDEKSPNYVPGKDVALLVKIHGIFMMLGWMLCVGPALLTPRYLRRHWTTMRFLNLQLWFVVHRSLMLLGVVFVIIAFVIILDVCDWTIIDMGPKYPDALHPIFGLTAVIIMFLNPIGALFRPKPNDKRRPIFNWAHGLLGGIGFTLAMANIIIGLVREYGWDGTIGLYPAIVWASCHVFVELLYLANLLIFKPSDKSPSQQAIAMTDVSGDAKEHQQNANAVPPAKAASYAFANSLFWAYAFVTVASTAAACSLIFVVQ